MIEFCLVPCCRCVARRATLISHHLFELPIMIILVTGRAGCCCKRISSDTVRGHRMTSIAKRRPVCACQCILNIVLCESKRRRYETLFRMASRTIILVCLHKLSLVLVGVTIGAFVMRELHRSCRRTLPLILVALGALHIGMTADQSECRQVMVKGFLSIKLPSLRGMT